MEPLLEIQRVPMSYDQWLALDGHPRSEWVDGVAILMPPPTPDHFDAGFHLTHLLRQADLAVFRQRPAGAVVEEIPLLGVEVISPSGGYRDTVQRAAEHAAAGVGQ